MKKALTSLETMKELKISACTLSHYRADGHLKFQKKGNSFLYEKESIESLKASRITEKSKKDEPKRI